MGRGPLLDPLTQEGIQLCRDGPQGATCCLLYSDPSQPIHMSSRESGQQRFQGLRMGSELRDREQGYPCPRSLPWLLEEMLKLCSPRTVTSEPSRPHPGSLLDPLARVGGLVGTVTPLKAL